MFNHNELKVPMNAIKNEYISSRYQDETFLLSRTCRLSFPFVHTKFFVYYHLLFQKAYNMIIDYFFLTRTSALAYDDFSIVER